MKKKDNTYTPAERFAFWFNRYWVHLVTGTLIMVLWGLLLSMGLNTRMTYQAEAAEANARLLEVMTAYDELKAATDDIIAGAEQLVENADALVAQNEELRQHNAFLQAEIDRLQALYDVLPTGDEPEDNSASTDEFWADMQEQARQKGSDAADAINDWFGGFLK